MEELKRLSSFDLKEKEELNFIKISYIETQDIIDLLDKKQNIHYYEAILSYQNPKNTYKEFEDLYIE